MNDVQIFVKPRRARPFFARHPWVFEGAIGRIEGRPAPGDTVVVRSDMGEFIAHGLFNPHSSIRVRLYSWREDQPISEELIAHRIEQAIDFRYRTLRLGDPATACRLVYSESDGLSGLIVDRFADVIVCQIGSLALARFESAIVNTLEQRLRPRTIYRRVDQATASLEKLAWEETLLSGTMPAGPVWVDIDGLILGVDPIHGQKTGAYLDQRENHRAVARFASDQEVLDVFSYAGGFSLTALRWGGARNVLAVDSSAEALSLARANADRNGLAIETHQGDAGNVMAELAREERRFGVVVCDPPKFASKSADVEGALRGYEYINRLAINLTASGGILATCSCSGLVSTELFLVMLAGAAEKDKRELRLVEVRSQSPDHPVSLSCPETAYLKCVIARVVD